MRCEIHDFCLDQGLKIARHDGQIPPFDEAFYSRFLSQMQQGSYFADFGSARSFSRASFRTHYLRPKSHLGYLPGIRNAGQTCEKFFLLSQVYWANRAYDAAAVFLGAAAHLVQDLCNPFHTTHKNLREHTQYERRMKNWLDHAVSSEGIYGFRPLDGHYRDDRAFGWVDFNAHWSGRLLHRVVDSSADPGNDEVFAKVLSYAQRTTAGFLALFFRSVQFAGAVPVSDSQADAASMPASGLEEEALAAAT